MTEDLKRIKEKIRALKVLAENSGATEGEAIAAINMAQKLCHQYDIDLANIEDDRQIEVELQVDKLTRDLRDYKIRAILSMDSAISKLFNCEMIYNDVKMVEHLLGVEHDRQTANYCIDFAHNTMHAGWEKYKRSQEYAVLRERYKSKQLKKDFMTGFAHGVTEKCYEMKQNQEEVKIKSTGTSLVIVKSEAIAKFKKQVFPNTHSTKRRPVTISSRRTVETGKTQGKSIEFTKPIESRKTCLLSQ